MFSNEFVQYISYVDIKNNYGLGCEIFACIRYKLIDIERCLGNYILCVFYSSSKLLVSAYRMYVLSKLAS